MVQTSYSNDKLFNLAKMNYRRLVEYCDTLVREGYWDEPVKILDKPIHEVLDMYVQAVMVNLSIYCGSFEGDQRKFIIFLPDHNAVGLEEGAEDDEAVIKAAGKLLSSPPILLQLCSLYDVDRDKTLTGQFFDSLVNILLAMSSTFRSQDGFAGKFIQEYYQKICVFINSKEENGGINARYIFKKLSSDWTEEGYFEVIKRTALKNEQNAQCLEKEKIKIDLPRMNEIKQEKLDAVKREMEEQQIRMIRRETEENNGGDRLARLLSELNNLIGLEGVKAEINSLINLIKVRKMRESYNMPSMDMTYHMVFTGNPGTGKTTVARLVAKIYKELGILSEGSLVETDRAGLVAGYVGQTALKVKEVVEKAIGGVLFIDEAYSLTNNAVSNDFGGEAIDTLVKMMEDNRENLVVIVAGYTKEMEEFLKSNTGLVSRFNKFIHFPDYTLDELIDILESMADRSGVVIEEEAKELLRGDIAVMPEERARVFGNARGIRNIFEKIIVNQANRIVTYENPPAEMLVQIKAEDAAGVI